MALKKVSKRAVYGSVLVSHYGMDMTDASTSSSTFTNWGDQLDFTPNDPKNIIEVVVTGSAQLTGNLAAGFYAGKLRLMINGQEEHLIRDIVGLNQQRSGDHSHQNQQFGEANGRQNFRVYGTGSTVYLNHLYQLVSNNKQEIQCQIATTSPPVIFQGGFMTVSELSDLGFNLT